MPAYHERTGTLALIRLDHGRINALDVGLRKSLWRALDESDGATAVVIVGRDNLFCGGSDLNGFESEECIPPTVTDLVARLVAFPIPVVACLAGPVLGGGFELALACGARVASPSARLSCPEINLGLLPGTQLLPRWTDVETALELMLSGRTIDASEAHRLGIVDVVSEAPLDDAQALGDRIRGVAHPAAGLIPMYEERSLAKLVTRFSRQTGGEPAPPLITELIAQGTKEPFGTVLAREDLYRQQLVRGAVFRALRYLFFANRSWRRSPNPKRDDAIVDALAHRLELLEPRRPVGELYDRSDSECVRVLASLAQAGAEFASRSDDDAEMSRIVDWLAVTRVGVARATGGPIHFSQGTPS